MPPESQKQRAAMRAAAAGNSTLGIPQSVGKDFSDADPGGSLPKQAPAPRSARPDDRKGLTALIRGKKKD